MGSFRHRIGLLLFLTAAAASPASAQIEQGRLTGTVTDAQGGVLPGVTVTASSPALLGTQAAVTETDGKFMFPSLPSGPYTLTFELPGFTSVKRENINLTIGQTLTINTQLQIATLQETVTVTSESPVVDVTTTKVGSDFSSEQLKAIPSATDLWAALGQAPGVRMQGFDVGGSHKSQQTGYESFGLRGQNRVLTEGVDTTEGDGGAGFYQDFFAHEEISVSAAGGDVAMNTPGAAVISTIKSGGNEFRSLTNVTYENEDFVGDNIDPDTAERGFTGNPNLLFWEAHMDLGGPVKRDRAWFYGAYNHFTIDKVISGVDRNIATDLAKFNNYTLKGTGKLTQNDTLIGYYQYGDKDKPFRGLSATIGPDSILGQSSPSWMYNAQWQRVWSNRLFSDLKVGNFGYDFPMVPNIDFATNPPRVDTATQVQTGAGWLTGSAGGPFRLNRNKPQAMFTMTYFLPDKAGSHDFKWGAEWFDDQSQFGNNGTSGPILYRDRAGAVDEIRVTDLGDPSTFADEWTAADDRNRRLAAFFQDRWSPTARLTLTLGVRWDRQTPYYMPSIRVPVLGDVFEAQETQKTTLLTRDSVAPRIGASWDVVGDGRSVIKTFYGRFYYNFADLYADVNPGGTNYRDYKFLDQNGNRLYDGAHELGTLVAASGGTSTTYDRDVELPYADEFSISFERQFWGESSARVAYVRKMTRNEIATFNVLREGQFVVPRDVAVTLRSFDQGVEGTQTFTVFDIPDALRGQVQNTITNIPDGDYNFDTIQVGFNKRFSAGLFIQSSFDYQWRDELRDNSASNSPLNSDPLAVDYFQNVFPEVPNRQESTNWQGRLMGRYVMPWGIGTAVNLRVQSGWQYSRLITVSLPNAGTQTFFMEPIANHRSDTVSLLDLRLDKTFSVNRFRFTVMADVFNLLNSNAVTNFNLSNGARFNSINAALDPRTAMLGFRFEF